MASHDLGIVGSLPNLSIISGPALNFKPQLLHRLFEQVIEEKYTDTALIFEDGETISKTTYQELNEKSNKIARFIVQTVCKQKLQRNSDGDFIIAVSMYPSDHLVTILLAIFKSGAAYLPLDPTFPDARIEYVCRDARPVMVIYDQDSDSFMNTTRISFRDILDKSLAQSPINLQESETLKYRNDDLAIVMYTSGSTGVPKGVRLLHKVIQNRLNWQYKTFPYSSTEKVGVFKTAVTFVDSVSEIWGPLLKGLAILVVKKTAIQDHQELVSLLEKYNIERLVLVPSLLRSLLMYLVHQKNKNVLEYLRLWVCSGETLDPLLAKDFYNFFSNNTHKLLNFYGSTEIMGDITYHIIDDPSQLKHIEKVPIGLPVSNTIIYLLDTNLRPVKVGDIGEICVSGLNLAAGYVNGTDPKNFIDNPFSIDPIFAKLYKTGDFGKLQNKTIIYEGRRDSQIKIRGHRVDLLEVEKAVNSLDAVEKGIVVSYRPGEVNQAILAFVTTAAFISGNQTEDLLKKKLLSYMVPQVVMLKTIPLLINGKVDKQLLLKNYETVHSNENPDHKVTQINYEGVPNYSMDGAKVLFETVASVLYNSARSAISVNANFYEIGGNSLNSILTITALNQKGYHISIGDFISAMDFGEVLRRMTKESKSLTSALQPRYTREVLKDEHKPIVSEIITATIYRKSNLLHWLQNEISTNDCTELIDAMWEPLLEKNLSFVAKNIAGEIEGVAMNFDARDEPQVHITSKMVITFQFLETIEGPIRDNELPPGKGKILHSFAMTTHPLLTPRDNVAIIHFMEEEVLKIATDKKFAGVFATNTSPLTQQLASDVFGYQTLLDYQVNQYVASDNTKPFGMAPNDQRAKVQWKPI